MHVYLLKYQEEILSFRIPVTVHALPRMGKVGGQVFNYITAKTNITNVNALVVANPIELSFLIESQGVTDFYFL